MSNSTPLRFSQLIKRKSISCHKMYPYTLLKLPFGLFEIYN
jgi:hypothetical protein